MTKEEKIKELQAQLAEIQACTIKNGMWLKNKNDYGYVVEVDYNDAIIYINVINDDLSTEFHSDYSFCEMDDSWEIITEKEALEGIIKNITIWMKEE